MSKEEVIDAYRNALKLYGVSELAIESYVAAFTTGYDTGTLQDEKTIHKMVNLLQYEDIVN